MSKSFVSDASPAGFLAECVTFAVYCRDHLHSSERTGQRLINQPDGLPIVEFGRKRLVHLPTADAWVKSRMRQRNPIRRGRAA